MRRLTCLCLWACLASAHHAFAADPENSPGPSPIVGQTVMGDKSRSGPDGWSWAPITRDRAPAGKAPGETKAKVASAPNAQPEAPGDYVLPPGADPGTPGSPRSSGPGAMDVDTSRAK